MTPPDLFGVAVRTVGLIVALSMGYAVFALASQALSFPGRLDDVGFWGLVLVPGAGLVVGLWLMRRSEVVVRFGFPASAQPLALSLLGKYHPRAGREYLAGRRGEGIDVPLTGRVWLQTPASHHGWVVAHARALAALGYELVANEATLKALWLEGVPFTALDALPGAPATALDALEAGAFAAVFATEAERELLERARDRGLLATGNGSTLERAVGGLVALHAEEALEPAR